MERRALILTLLSYIGCIVVIATAPELFPGQSTDYASLPALITIILLGAYWFFRGVRPGPLVRFFAILGILLLIIITGASTQASTNGTRNQAATSSQFKVHTFRDYARNCLLTPVPQTSHSSSGYAVVSFAGAEALSEGYCNGVGYIDTRVHTSGVYGRANAQGVLSFIDPGIFPATNPSAQSYTLNVALDFILNGWQVSHGAGFLVASSSISLDVEFDIIDEQGSIVFNIFGDSWQGSQNLATGDHQLSYSIELMPGHTYSAALKFTETATASVYGLAGDAGATGCLHFDALCSADPFLGSDFYCPAFFGTGISRCQDFEWRSMAFSLTAV